MEFLTEIMNLIIYTVVHSVSQWLPISQDGHLVILEDFFPLTYDPNFTNAALISMQFGAILAILFLFLPSLNPLSPNKSVSEMKSSGMLWLKIIFASLPGIVIYAAFQQFIEERFYNGIFIALMVFVMALGLNWADSRQVGRHAKVINNFSQMTLATAFKIGIFQALAIIPGWSRSATIIIAGRFQAVERSLIAKFYFLISLPTLLLINILSIFNVSFNFTLEEWMYLSLIFGLAFFLSIITIHFFSKYIRNGRYAIFGSYSLLNAAILVLYFLFF